MRHFIENQMNARLNSVREVSKLHLLGIMNVCTKFHGNVS